MLTIFYKLANLPLVVKNMDLWTVMYISSTIFITEIGFSFELHQTPSVQERLYENLLVNYSKYARPVKDPTAPLKLSFTFELIKIHDVNAKQQKMSLSFRLKQEWQDHYLRWNISKYSGFASLHVSPSKLWVPDVGLYNEMENKDHKKTDITTNVLVSPNGTCRWSVPSFIHSMCAIDVSFFPLDLQQCSLRFGSLTYNADEVQIEQGKLVYPSKNMIKNGEWFLYNVSITTDTVWDHIRRNNFTVVEVTLKMERDSAYYVIEMLIPCLLISCLTILGFILPPESGERMSLGMLILLAMTFFQQMIMKLIPLQDFPILSQYFFITSVEVQIALLVTTVSLNFYHCSDKKMPRFLKLLVLEFLGRITRIRAPDDDKTVKVDYSATTNVTNSERQFDIELNESRSFSRDETDDGLNDSSVGLVHCRNDRSLSSTSSYSSIRTEDDQNEVEENSDERMKDWILAARIVDRFSMYASFVIGLLTILIVFLRAPVVWRDRTGMDE